MNEQTWLQGVDAFALMQFMHARASSRKKQLLLVACARIAQGDSSDEQNRQLIDSFEFQADNPETNEVEIDGLLDPVLDRSRDLVGQARLAFESSQGVLSEHVRSLLLRCIAADHAYTIGTLAWWEIAELWQDVEAGAEPRTFDQAYRQVEIGIIYGSLPIIRDIFGNPFRPVTLDPRWLTSTVLDLANTIYEHRQFEKMPILADALMDAGCDSEEIINHCQGPGPHVSGCWLVDLLTGRK